MANFGSRCRFPQFGTFMIACCSGMSKPADVNDFLKEFCEEIGTLAQNGVKVGSAQLLKEFSVRLFTCDSPARAFINGVKGHTTKNSCPKCLQMGQHLDRVCLSQEVGELRTDDSFKNRLDLSFHKQREVLLESVNIGMVSQFPLEPMHLVDLGVTKKILQLLIKRGNVTRMNEKLMYLNNYFPSEFSRRSRDLDELGNWKSTEYRQFLLYSGIFVLKDCIPDNLYYNFLLLHCAVRLLSCEKSCKVESNVANEMLKEFVKLFNNYFGTNLISFHVHGLLHLSDCVKQFGPLDSFSAYKFENIMQYIKKLIHNPSKILQ
ncbi:uncharacterized protein [Eurosta solidaginis]|uniref:uncharacterized protein n=1 Tax=Eurosta solidaginis TaxID=178769 RepID=UPI0035310566